jgi:hypothetical protein
MKPQTELIPEKQNRQTETEKLIQDTMAAIDQAGYCLWTCSNLSDTVICVVQDNDIENSDGRLKISWEQFMIMQEYPVYTLDELRLLSLTDDWTQQVIIDLKRLTGIQVYKVEIPRKRKPVIKKQGFEK